MTIQHAIALAALPPSNLTALEASALSLGFHASRCNFIPRHLVRPGDCFAAIDHFYGRKNPGGALSGNVICTADETRHADPAYIVLPDEEVFATCWVTWRLPRGLDVPVTWTELFHSTRYLVEECITRDSYEGVSIFGPDRARVVRIGVERAIGGGNRTATESIDVA